MGYYVLPQRCGLVPSTNSAVSCLCMTLAAGRVPRGSSPPALIAHVLDLGSTVDMHVSRICVRLRSHRGFSRFTFAVVVLYACFDRSELF